MNFQCQIRIIHKTKIHSFCQQACQPSPPLPLSPLPSNKKFWMKPWYRFPQPTPSPFSHPLSYLSLQVKASLCSCNILTCRMSQHSIFRGSTVLLPMLYNTYIIIQSFEEVYAWYLPPPPLPPFSPHPTPHHTHRP